MGAEGRLEGKAAVVTGAGSGIGRVEAMAAAALERFGKVDVPMSNAGAVIGFTRQLCFDYARRWAQPEELAAAALFLASDEASFVNGAVYVVDGGFDSK